MNPGKRRERITFQVLAETATGYGGFSNTWANVASNPTVWAEVIPVRGSEDSDGGREATRQTYLITVRYRTDINTKHRIVWGSEVMDINSVQNRDMRKRYTTIEAESGVAE